MPTVQITELAQSDLLDAWSYIAIENIGAADHVVDVIGQEANTLALQPKLGRARPELYENLRFWPTSVAYNLYYFPTDNGIVLVRVLHQSRDVQSGDFLAPQGSH